LAILCLALMHEVNVLTFCSIANIISTRDFLPSYLFVDHFPLIR
jgi:hypothetical protein